MKKLTYLTAPALLMCMVMCGLLLSSCDSMSPKFGDTTEPFVVTEIKKQTNGMCRYYGHSNGIVKDYFEADKGLFNIGDTIKVCK